MENHAYRGLPLFVQKTADGWFAKLELEDQKAIFFSGPWGTRRYAQWALVDAIDLTYERDSS